VTTGTVRFIAGILGLVVALLTGVVGAVRYVTKVQEMPTGAQFHDHIISDSVIHHEQAVHSAFQDSMILKAVTDNHRMGCFVSYSMTLCSDVTQPPRKP
jgi:hypothetical protein